MLHVAAYFILLLFVAAYAAACGRSDERVAAATILIGSFASLALLLSQHRYYAHLEVGVAAIDTAALAAFIWVALRSMRFWPLWIAGLQLTATTGHLMKWLVPDLFPAAYAASIAFWSYPILLIIAVGTWRGRRRERRAMPLMA